MTIATDAPQTSPARAPHRLIRASAGSGKTFQLTNRLIELLLSGEDPGSLLATTFTRAAAGEILHRTLQRLAEGAVDDDALKTMRQQIGETATHPNCADALERVVGEMHRLSIMTIDAFFMRLASSFSFELGLAPPWRMIDEEEDPLVRAEAVERTLREAHDHETLELLRDLQGEEIRLHAHEAIMRAVEEGYEAFLATTRDPAAWESIAPVGRALDAAAMSAARRALGEVELPLTAKGEPDKRWAGALASTMIDAETESWEQFLKAGFGKKVSEAQASGVDPSFSGKPMPEALVAAVAPLVDHARWRLTTEHAGRTKAARRLLERFDEAYLRAKRERSGVTFADPPRLLLEEAPTEDLAHVYYRLDARIRHVLLDEFQDTSMTQFRLLEPILDEILSQDAEGQSVFCVGDVKQSLYAWRQAEPALLPALALRWETLREESLSVSWRSSPAVLNAVNGIFGDFGRNAALLEKDAGVRAAAAWDAGFEAHEAAPRNRDLSGAARLLVADEAEDADDSDKAARRAALETCAERVALHRQCATSASIAVIVRTGADLRTALAMLKARGIDASEQRGNALVDPPPVAAACSALRLIDHPGHTAALRHVAQTPLGEAIGLRADAGGGEVRRLAARFRRRIAEAGCADVLSEWLAACAPAMDARGAERFGQLIDVAEAFDAAGRGGPSDLATLCDTRRVDEPGEAPVRVMTIHGAKGLEFDVVVSPLAASKNWQVDARNVLAAREEPLGDVTRVTRYPSEIMQRLSAELRALHEAQHEKDITEELCCLYVTATRAKRCLELVAPVDKAGRRGEALGGDEWRLRPDHVVRAALAPDLPASPGTTLWETTAGEDWAADPAFHRRHAGGADSAREDRALRTHAPKRRSGARLGSASPSRAGATGVANAALLLRGGDAHARMRGALVHLWFEQIEWLDDGAPSDDDLRPVAERHGFRTALVDETLPEFRRALASPDIRRLLTRAGYEDSLVADAALRALRERSFAVREAHAEGDRLLEGRFDRLVIAERDGVIERVEVIDFKTDALAEDASEEEVEVAAERHRGQMEAYRRAAARQTGVGEDRVAMRIALTGAGRVATLSKAASVD